MWNYSGFCTSYISYRTLLWKLSLLYVLNANYLILFRKVPFLVLSIMNLLLCLGVDWCTWANTWWFQCSRVERLLFKTDYLFSSVQSNHCVRYGQEGRSVCTLVCVCTCIVVWAYAQTIVLSMVLHRNNMRKHHRAALITSPSFGIQAEVSNVFRGPWGNLSFLLK